MKTENSSTYPVIILTGGKSTRLGRDKASEVLAGTTLLQRAVDACDGLASRYVIVTARGQRLPPLTARVPVDRVEDAYPETGPLGGVYTGLRAMAGGALGAGAPAPQIGACLVLACDLPLLQPDLLCELLRIAPGHDAVVPVKDGLPEPLCAVYTAGCIEPARRLLGAGAYKVAGLLEQVDALLLPESQWRTLDPDGLSFLNVNREGDLRRARDLLGESGL